MITNDMIAAAILGLSQEIKEQNESEPTQTNKNLIVAFLTQALALKENGYNRDEIENLLKDNASNMIEIALETLYK